MDLVIEDVLDSLAIYAEMHVALPENMSPDDVSDILELPPTKKQKKGNIICRPSGRIVRTMEQGCWVLCTENQVKSGNMDVHLEWLLNRLMPAKDQILTLQKVPGLSMRVRCVWGSKECDTGADFTVEEIKKWAELNLGFSFELYSDSDEIIKEGTEFYGR
jgi:hypothetical protein